MTYEGFKFQTSYVPPSKRQMEDALNECADLLSRGCDLRLIADVMGVTRGSVCVFLHQIRTRLGMEQTA
jgi:DNA-binding NarL/FixJ family response regulator